MKLFNVIIVHDVYCAAETEEDAIKTILDAIHAAPEDRLAHSEEVANEAKTDRTIRAKWVDEKPFVGLTISDDDFEQLKGKTTLEACKLIYTKPEK